MYYESINTIRTMVSGPGMSSIFIFSIWREEKSDFDPEQVRDEIRRKINSLKGIHDFKAMTLGSVAKLIMNNDDNINAVQLSLGHTDDTGVIIYRSPNNRP